LERFYALAKKIDGDIVFYENLIKIKEYTYIIQANFNTYGVMKMSFANKLMALSTVLGLMTFTSSAALAANADATKVETSQEDAILFRIENIKPIANEEGITEKCSFILTVYNRMAEEITEANMTLKWKDTIEDKYKIVGDNVESKDAKEALQVVEKEISIDTIPPHVQRSFQSLVDTNKCFLLFDNLEYTVNNCIVAGEKIMGKDSKVSVQGGSCNNKFDYINSQNPEYYSEFKDTPESVLEKQATTAEEKQVEVIDGVYSETVGQLQKIEDTLAKIK